MCDFVGVNRFTETSTNTIYKNSYNIRVASACAHALGRPQGEKLVPDIAELEKLLGWDCLTWVTD